MTVWILLRLVKFLGVILFGAGVLGTLQRDQSARQVAAQRTACVGFTLTWISGFFLVQELGLPLTAPWILASMLTSVVALNGALRAAESADRAVLPAVIAHVGLVGTLVLMSWRPT